MSKFNLNSLPHVENPEPQPALHVEFPGEILCVGVPPQLALLVEFLGEILCVGF